MLLTDLRKQYHRLLCSQILRVTAGIPNIADNSNRASIAIANAIVAQLGATESELLSGQRKGNQFEAITRDFLVESFALLHHLRPGNWVFSAGSDISQFEQYKHLAYVQQVLTSNPELASALGGDYLVTPDIVVGRYPINENELNSAGQIIKDHDAVGQYTPLRIKNTAHPSLHASISCKWTIRSDRAQNVRTEALNLIRNRKGHTPRIAVVTAEPLPTRLASLALGTGDLDCVYHFALNELIQAVTEVDQETQLDMLRTLIEGNRLRDISDLPLDLAV